MSTPSSDEVALLADIDSLRCASGQLKADAVRRLSDWAALFGSGEPLVQLGIAIEARVHLGGCRFFFNESGTRDVPAIERSKFDDAARERSAFYEIARSAYSLAQQKDHPDAAFRLGRLLCKGWHGNKSLCYDISLGRQQLEAAAERGHPAAMVWTANFLIGAYPDAERDEERAQRLYERAIESGSISAMYNLATLISTQSRKDGRPSGYSWDEIGLGSHIDPEIYDPARKWNSDESALQRSRQLLRTAALAGHSSAMYDLGVVHQYAQPIDLPLAAAWYIRAKEAGNLNKYFLSKKLEGSMQGVPPDPSVAALFTSPHPSTADQLLTTGQRNAFALPMALQLACAAPRHFTLSFLQDTLRAEHVTSTPAVFAAHNLVLLALRMGVLKRDNLHSIGSTPWFIRDNIYGPAAKLVDADTDLINAIFMHAETVGIIPDGYIFKLVRDTRIDNQKALDQASNILNDLYARVQDVNKRVHMLEENTSNVNNIVKALCKDVTTLHKTHVETKMAVESLGNSPESLRTLIRRQQKRDMSAAVMSLVFSAIPFIGGMLGASASTASSFLGLTASELVEAGSSVGSAAASVMLPVDISSFNLAAIAFSPVSVSKLSAENSRLLQDGIEKGGFKNANEVRELLKCEMNEQMNDKTTSYFISMQSKYWAEDELKTQSAQALSSSDNSHVSKARKLFEVHAMDSADKHVSLRKATQAMQHLLEQSSMGSISEDEFEDMFFETASEKDVEVSEEIFVKIYHKIYEKKNNENAMASVKEVVSNYFTTVTDGVVAVRPAMAQRLLVSAIELVAEKKLIASNPFDGNSERVKEEAGKFQLNSSGRIEQEAFVEVVCALVLTLRLDEN